jgi:hypothetical protein
MKSLKFNNRGEEVILDLNTVEHIVNKWYLNGMYDGILQDQDGDDLEEVLNVDYSVEIETTLE